MTQSLGDPGRVGFDQADLETQADVDEQIRQAWRGYLVDTLGWSAEAARQRAARSESRQIGKSVVSAMQHEIGSMQGLRVLDLGSGLGDVALEFALAGATVTAVEPCAPWLRLSEQRARLLGVDVEHLDADGHQLPFDDGRFDVVVSLQVLEHVRDPARVVRELARVLKPGGSFRISCENYLSFWEPHYGVRWLPALPKWLGAPYLRMRGRDPRFLREDITYVYWPRLARIFIEAGLVDDAWRETVVRGLDGTLGGKKGRLLAGLQWCLGKTAALAALVAIEQRRCLFRTGFQACGTKL